MSVTVHGVPLPLGAAEHINFSTAELTPLLPLPELIRVPLKRSLVYGKTTGSGELARNNMLWCQLVAKESWWAWYCCRAAPYGSSHPCLRSRLLGFISSSGCRNKILFWVKRHSLSFLGRLLTLLFKWELFAPFSLNRHRLMDKGTVNFWRRRWHRTVVFHRPDLKQNYIFFSVWWICSFFSS